MFEVIERRFGPLAGVALDRCRAVSLRLRGAKLGSKSRVGARVTVLRPWCVSVGKRCQFEHAVYIKASEDSTRILLGDHVFVGYNTEFDISLELTIGDNVLIAPGCFITDHNHQFDPGVPIDGQGCVSRSVRIGDDVWLGAQVIVLAGVTIGRGAIVAAGALVNRDVAAMSIVAGVPARTVGTRERTSG